MDLKLPLPVRFAIPVFLLLFSCAEAPEPEPIGPLPSERQLAWHQLEYYAFVHFNMNTFTNMEWGLGDEPPSRFNPTELDVNQWARVAREAGMKGIIITAKHHDGFCLWPTATTEHSVKNSPWKNGQGDLIKELSEACMANGLKFGVYLSPWDRNHPDYGRPEYVADYHEQLRELLTGYGDIFEVWFDGANGGSGYYGGANETRKIDNKTYYQWDTITTMVRDLQPNAVIFSDGGPDIRWVGNEEGWADETNWSIMRRDEIYPGWPRYVELRSGHIDGTHWLPAEADVSIRPGWYYHPSEDHRVKSLPQLVDIYYHSVGRNAALLLNLPVDNRGLVHENDVARLMELRKQLDRDFATDLAAGAEVQASNTRAGAVYNAAHVTDGDPRTYWATEDGVSSASLTFTFDEPTALNRILLQEFIALGQRVKSFSVEVDRGGEWTEISRQTTIGYKRILRFNTVTTSAVRLNILSSKGPPLLGTVSLYEAPVLLYPPVLSRDLEGKVHIRLADEEAEAFYTLDGSDPTGASARYEGPFMLDRPAEVRAMAISPKDGNRTEVVATYFDIPRGSWKVISPEGEVNDVQKMIDENPETFWAIEPSGTMPQEVVIDLGKVYPLRGFTFWPMQERWSFGIFTNYELYTATELGQWKLAASGEFGNIMNNPVEQKVRFAASTARFIKLRALNVQGEDRRASFGDIGVITVNE